MTTNNVSNITNVASGTPVSGVGSYVKISTQTASASAIIEFTALSNTYRQYYIVCEGILPSNSGDAIYIQVGSVGAGYQTTGINAVGLSAGLSHAISIDQGSNVSAGALNFNAGIGSTSDLSKACWANILITGHDSTTTPLIAKVDSWFYGDWSGSQYQIDDYKFFVPNQGSSNTYTKIKFFPSTGGQTINAGTFTMYGITA